MTKIIYKSKKIGISEAMKEYAERKLKGLKANEVTLSLSLTLTEHKFVLTLATDDIRITKKGTDYYDLVTKVSKLLITKELEKVHKQKSKKVKVKKQSKEELKNKLIEEQLTDEFRPEGSLNQTSQEVYEDTVAKLDEEKEKLNSKEFSSPELADTNQTEPKEETKEEKLENKTTQKELEEPKEVPLKEEIIKNNEPDNNTLKEKDILKTKNDRPKKPTKTTKAKPKKKEEPKIIEEILT